ncbi:hypothetical protein KHA94_00625 [Bacillus sp. FJAT-49705]|uniref:Uncharacterized protein n=1 Tax=Cytobacillus citreus TaxID=2833586 RepID=A0ABS5NLM9_9BACI|nr:hypothetical protein [Cytobacillus citreus]MBS4188722.1 hypothetical protein [Cytobacillus citreus]
MVNFYLYVFTPLLSFIGGFFAYTLTLKIVWEQSLGGDMVSVLFWGGIMFFLVSVPIYLGVIYFIDKRTKKFKGLLYPIGCMLVFFIPTLFITLSFGGINPFSSEAMLFHSFFFTSGLIFGLCSWGFKKFKTTSAI